MFDNITEKLKTIANVLFKIGFIVAIIMCIAALALLSEASGATVTLIIAAAVLVGSTYVSCALIHSFAVLIEKVAHISNYQIPKLVNNTTVIANNTKKEPLNSEENQ